MLAAAFSQWREGVFAKLSGMFAFAIYDTQDNLLYLVRDSVGIKPLYYSLLENHLVFASEVQALKETGFHYESNPNWPVYFMAYGHLPEPITTLKEVHPLPKGFFLKYEVLSKKASFQSYCHHSYSGFEIPKQDAVRRIRELMVESVENHLLSHAKIGVFLSGGLDSGIIASLAKKQKKDIQTLSVFFEEESFSEKKYQDKINAYLQVQSHQLLLAEADFHYSFQTILDSMDLPSCDGINTWFISKYAKDNGFKAVLSGLGADELYGGYPSFHRMNLSRMIAYTPDFLRSLFKSSQKKKLNRLIYLNLKGPKGLYLFLRGHFSPFEIAKQLDAKESSIWELLETTPVFIEAENNLSDKNLASWIEFHMYMQNQLLRDADVMSMTHGVELRVPFLDKKHIEFAMSMKENIKYPTGISKQLLINAFKDDLPEMIWNRPKMGFSLPFSHWLLNSPKVMEMTDNGSRQTKMNFSRFEKGQLHWSQLMTLLIMHNRKVA